MKKVILTSLLAISILFGHSQVALLKTYNYSTTVVQLETLGYKYFLMDVPAKQVRIYNMDHSIYKTINCSVPNGYYLSDVKYVSQNLFDTDSDIEIAYTYYKYVSTTTSYYYIYGSEIINENGTNVIQAISNAQYLTINKTGDSEYKLFAYCFDYSTTPEKVWTNIYSLPGSLVSAQNYKSQEPDAIFNAFPNPASNFIQITYELPDNIKNANLLLTDAVGRQVKNYQIDNHIDNLKLNVNELPSGVYNYHIEYGNIRTDSKKIIIQ